MNKGTGFYKHDKYNVIIELTKEELYLHYIQNMCALLEAEAPMSEIYDWFDDMVHLNLYERNCLTHRGGE